MNTTTSTAPTLLLRCRLAAAAAADSDSCGSNIEHVWEIYDRRLAYGRRHLAHRRFHAANGTIQQVVTQLELGDWLRLCEAGHPKALDVMFAPPEDAAVDRIRGLRTTFRIDPAAAKKPFEAAMKEEPAQRHRLSHNLAALARWGRYDPTEWRRTTQLRQRIEVAA